eukprot:4513183-Amphidinium_carterae.1
MTSREQKAVKKQLASHIVMIEGSYARRQVGAYLHAALKSIEICFMPLNLRSLQMPSQANKILEKGFNLDLDQNGTLARRKVKKWSKH